MIKSLVSITFGLALAACSGTATLLDYTPVSSSLNLQAYVGSAMVQTVSLPSYAAAEEVSVETAPGRITSSDLLWADAPERAMTLKVARHLDAILTATVSPDPWPFPGLPDVIVDIRVADMVARADGLYHLTGTYYIGGDGIDFRNTSSAFDIALPLASAEISAVADAQARAVLQLSESIARKLGR